MIFCVWVVTTAPCLNNIGQEKGKKRVCVCVCGGGGGGGGGGEREREREEIAVSFQDTCDDSETNKVTVIKAGMNR